MAEDLQNETETVLDHRPVSVPHQAESHLADVAATPGAVASADFSGDIRRLEGRMDALESQLRKREQAFRGALNTFADYLQSLSADIRKAGD